MCLSCRGCGKKVRVKRGPKGGRNGKMMEAHIDACTGLDKNSIYCYDPGKDDPALVTFEMYKRLPGCEGENNVLVVTEFIRRLFLLGQMALKIVDLHATDFRDAYNVLDAIMTAIGVGSMPQLASASEVFIGPHQRQPTRMGFLLKEVNSSWKYANRALFAPRWKEGGEEGEAKVDYVIMFRVCPDIHHSVLASGILFCDSLASPSASASASASSAAAAVEEPDVDNSHVFERFELFMEKLKNAQDAVKAETVSISPGVDFSPLWEDRTEGDGVVTRRVRRVGTDKKTEGGLIVEKSVSAHRFIFAGESGKEGAGDSSFQNWCGSLPVLHADLKVPEGEEHRPVSLLCSEASTLIRLVLASFKNRRALEGLVKGIRQNALVAVRDRAQGRLSAPPQPLDPGAAYSQYGQQDESGDIQHPEMEDV
uniref:Uncharacterized protein n=1 Tax=Chromera velia CCMP2878 TaxID=1169474 RepID=A0A0G4GP94_9ALVE|eukprot:Cvel_22771.t1-p1 / transcript=Cvel_22771.t1 / gene=Cvel_22771 / organism=Chromera_velia_CCMP2878 / gene_product=hypothetical protein / transcript_product=hypothetical protein / location=Cvel_scaffold2275:24900-28046(-) / protein_length=423 / sequence_SO=supercontig / SO=protein_coding / is_pseudo=false